MKVSFWTYLAFELNACLDEGMVLPIEETRRAFEEGRALDYLKRETAGRADLSLLNQDAAEVNKTLADIVGGMGASRDRRKMGVERNGLCLGVAYALEAIQQMT